MTETVYTSRCCGNCRFVDDSTPSLRCRRNRTGTLIVDAFFECPLWKEKIWEEDCGGCEAAVQPV